MTIAPSASVPTFRRSHTIYLEILPTSPLTHGSGNAGNTQEFLRRPVLVPRRNPTTGKWTHSVESIPTISGASFRAKLRMHALNNACALMNIPDGSFEKDKWRLLIKGGHLDGSGKKVNEEQIRLICNLFPMLTLFGAMDNSLSMTGALKVDHVSPYCSELLYGGLIPESKHFKFWTGDPSNPHWPAFADDPPSFLDAVGSQNLRYFRHDGANGPAARLLKVEDMKQIQDKRAEVSALVAAGNRVDKEDRREATEAMIYEYQAIIPGTPLWSILRTDPISDVEFAGLLHAIGSWKQAGAHLGGAESKGHGHNRVRVAGAFTVGAAEEAVAQTGLVIPDLDDPHEPLVRAYEEHMRNHAEAARAFVAGMDRDAPVEDLLNQAAEDVATGTTGKKRKGAK